MNGGVQVAPLLQINRNLYLHFLNHQEKTPNEPCYVPPNPSQSSRLTQYMKAIQRLEEMNLIVVDRESAFYYTGWVMRSPEDPINEHSPEQIHSDRDLLWRSGR
jgi:hypothetical protein